MEIVVLRDVAHRARFLFVPMRTATDIQGVHQTLLMSQVKAAVIQVSSGSEWDAFSTALQALKPLVVLWATQGMTQSRTFRKVRNG